MGCSIFNIYESEQRDIVEPFRNIQVDMDMSVSCKQRVTLPYMSPKKGLLARRNLGIHNTLASAITAIRPLLLIGFVTISRRNTFISLSL